MQNRTRVALALALVAVSCLATPLESRALAGSCHGQSCKIAALSGSSGKPYDPKKPALDRTDAGDCCILRHNPSARKVLYEQTPGLQSYCQTHKPSLFERAEVSIAETPRLEERLSCRKYTLIFSKGTDETGRLGESVGPALKQGLDQAQPGLWSVQGPVWNNDQFDNYCLGLRGGAHARDLLEHLARKCPDTEIIMGGYSQGAMVTRNGIAYAHKKARKRVKGVVTFGDPFNGAPIKGYKGPIKIYCNKGDRVCDGRDIITEAHLSYVGTDTTDAVNYIIKHFG